MTKAFTHSTQNDALALFKAASTIVANSVLALDDDDYAATVRIVEQALGKFSPIEVNRFISGGSDPATAAQIVYAALETEASGHEQAQRRLEAFADEHGFCTDWLLLNVKDLDAPHDWPGAKSLLLIDQGKLDQFVTGHYTRPVHREPINGSTWLDLWRAADAAYFAIDGLDFEVVNGFSTNAPENGIVFLNYQPQRDELWVNM